MQRSFPLNSLVGLDEIGRSLILAGLLAVGLWASASESRAQMFGQQRPSAMDSGSVSGEGTLLRGNERFIRGNRRGSNFVGSDIRDRRGFVGMQQGGTGQAVLPRSVNERRTPNVNTTAASAVNRVTGAYAPRLSVAFEVAAPSDAAITDSLVRQLQATPGLHPASRIEVSVGAGLATLRGTVASERDRALIERLILFEPGVSSVRNDLKVTATPPAPEAESNSPSDLPPRSAAGK